VVIDQMNLLIDWHCNRTSMNFKCCMVCGPTFDNPFLTMAMYYVWPSLLAPIGIRTLSDGYGKPGHRKVYTQSTFYIKIITI